MRGHATYVDQCSYELQMPDSHGNQRPVKKPTCFFTTKASMFTHLAANCTGDHQHTHLHPDGGNRSEHAENYPNKLAKKLAHLMVNDEADDYDYDEVLAADDGSEQVAQDEAQGGQESAEVANSNGDHDHDHDPIKVNNDLRKKHGRQAVNYIARLHRSLGHPSAEMLRVLEEVQATDNVKAAARGYMCGICASRRKPGSVPPAAGRTARRFGDRLCADSAWIETTSGRKCLLTLMDQATRYIAVRLLHSEQGTDFIKGVERAWIKQFGCLKYLRVDEAKGWASGSGTG